MAGTPYTLVWANETYDDLAWFWLNASGPERRRITVASKGIEDALRSDPDHHCLRSNYHPDIWIVERPPLEAHLRISPADRTVEVILVRYTPPESDENRS